MSAPRALSLLFLRSFKSVGATFKPVSLLLRDCVLHCSPLDCRSSAVATSYHIGFEVRLFLLVALSTKAERHMCFRKQKIQL